VKEKKRLFANRQKKIAEREGMKRGVLRKKRSWDEEVRGGERLRGFVTVFSTSEKQKGEEKAAAQGQRAPYTWKKGA